MIQTIKRQRSSRESLGHPADFVGPSFSDHIGTLWPRISERFEGHLTQWGVFKF